jgi:hypothetical protein
MTSSLRKENSTRTVKGRRAGASLWKGLWRELLDCGFLICLTWPGPWLFGPQQEVFLTTGKLFPGRVFAHVRKICRYWDVLLAVKPTGNGKFRYEPKFAESVTHG